MDILFAIRADYMERIGGDTFQFLFTKQHLEQCHHVNIIVIKTPEEIEQYGHVQVVHVFNMQDREWTQGFLKKAKECGKKTILSTIYWDLNESCFVTRIAKLTSSVKAWAFLRPLRPVLDLAADLAKRRSLGGKQVIAEYRELLRNVDMILPNSPEEAEIVKKTFDSHNFQVCSVPNAIKPVVDRADVKPVDAIYKDCIIEVGRIEPVKNQKAIVEACMDNDIPIVFIGRDNHPSYCKQLRQLAEKRGNVYFLGEMPQEEIAGYYAAAKVHVLPSFRESPGLVTLEAMYYGCNVVVANEKYCPIKYYQLDKNGYVCDPFSVSSLKSAIEKAYADDKKTYDEALFQFISYENVAKLTYEAYQKVLEL